MLQVKNSTPFKASIALLPDAHGVDTAYVIVKGTFTIGERLTVADEQLPVALADEYHDDPQSSSIRIPSDVCLMKPGTDVVVLGSAWAPAGTPSWRTDVSVSVGPLFKTVRVFGDRVWTSTAAGASIAWVAPFVRLPLVWERAFGGSRPTAAGPVSDPRNPAGKGLLAKAGGELLEGAVLPNVEDPSQLIGGPADAPPPAGFAPIAPSWEPRRSLAGTYDERWQRDRAPYLPRDFDLRFFHLAASGLVANGYLEGGEPVELLGLTPAGTSRFVLPRLAIDVRYRFDAGTDVRRAVLDTVIIEPDASRLALVWRTALACDKRTLKLREVDTSAMAA